MRAEEIRPVDLTTGAGYDSQWALMRDLFVWLDLRLYYFYAHHQWLGPASEMKNMLGLVVTREEFEHQLARSAQMGLEEELEPEESAQIGEAQAAIAWALPRIMPACEAPSSLSPEHETTSTPAQSEADVGLSPASASTPSASKAPEPWSS